MTPTSLDSAMPDEGRPAGPAPLLKRVRGRRSLARRAVDDVLAEFLGALLGELEADYATRESRVSSSHRGLTELHNLIEEERSDLEIFPFARFCRARIMLAIAHHQGRAIRSHAALAEIQAALSDFQRRRRAIDRRADVKDISRFYEKNYWHLRTAVAHGEPIDFPEGSGFTKPCGDMKNDTALAIDAIMADMKDELKCLRRRDQDSGLRCLEFFFRYTLAPVGHIIRHADARLYKEAHRHTPRELSCALREVVEIIRATGSLGRLQQSTLDGREHLIDNVKPISWQVLQKVSACHRENPHHSFVAAFDNPIVVIGEMLHNQQHFVNTFNERRELAMTGADEFKIPPSASWRGGHRNWVEPNTAQQVLFDLRRMIESHATKEHYKIKSDADGDAIVGHAFMTMTTGAALSELKQELEEMGLPFQYRIVRDRKGDNPRGTHEYYADIHWGGRYRAHETCFYARVLLGNSRARSSSGIKKFVEKQARMVGLRDVSDWEIVDYLRDLAGRTPRSVYRMVYRYRELRGFPRGMTIDRLLGEDTCSHGKGSWRIADNVIEGLPGRAFSCPDCRRERIAFAPAHKLPVRDETNALIKNEELYLARWRELQFLRGEEPTRASSLDELRRMERALDLRRGRFAIQRGEIVPLIDERTQTAPAKTLGGVLRRQPAPALAAAG